MDTVAVRGISRGLLRYSNWDALFIGLSVLHLFALVWFVLPLARKSQS